MRRSLRVYVLLLCASAASAQWVQLNSGTNSALKGISAPSGMIATAVGQNAVILRTTDGGQSWVPQAGEPGITCNAVSFADEATGLIGGTSGTILFTTNSGTVWQTIETGWMHPYYAAHQLSPQIGAVAGVNSVFQPIVGLTSNGWQTHNFSVFYPFHDGSYHEGTIRGIEFVTADIGLAAVAIFDGQGAICRTTDGGLTWETVHWNPYAFYAIDFPVSNASQIGYAVGWNGTIAHTTDGGQTWTSQLSPTTQTLNGVSFPSLLEGWAVGDNGTIIHTIDGGENWTEQTSPNAWSLRAVSFAGADTGYAVGDNGTIIFTPNGGEATNHPPGEFFRITPPDSLLQVVAAWFEWSESVDPDGDAVTYLLRRWCDDAPEWGDLTLVMTSTDTVLYLPYPDSVGAFYTIHWSVRATDGYDTVMATNGEGVFYSGYEIRADDPFILHPSSFTLSAYPNPFNPTTTLALSLPVSCEVVLRIFDVTGRLVRESALGRLPSGAQEISFDGSDLPSGIYLAAVETPTVRLTHKLVLLK